MAAIGAESRMHRSPRASLDWPRRLSQCTSRFKRSAVREILKAAVRPEVISFAGGLPAPMEQLSGMVKKLKAPQKK